MQYNLGGNKKRPATLSWHLLTVADAKKVKNALKALKHVESMKYVMGLSENAAILVRYFEMAFQQKFPSRFERALLARIFFSNFNYRRNMHLSYFIFNRVVCTTREIEDITMIAELNYFLIVS
ncbi:MAG: hypothetical protein ACTSU9_05885 [Promethearchaeota archaeon]